MSLPRPGWSFGAVAVMALIFGGPVVVLALISYGVGAKLYDNYYPPRVAELAAKAEAERALDARGAAEFARPETQCAMVTSFASGLEDTFQPFIPARLMPGVTREQWEEIQAKLRKDLLANWQQRCSGYYVDPESWKKAKGNWEVRAIKMSREQLCADKNILAYTLTKPYRDQEKREMSESDIDAYLRAREAMQTWYFNAWDEACGRN